MLTPDKSHQSVSAVDRPLRLTFSLPELFRLFAKIQGFERFQVSTRMSTPHADVLLC